jgi:hypothetical protein
MPKVPINSLTDSQPVQSTAEGSSVRLGVREARLDADSEPVAHPKQVVNAPLNRPGSRSDTTDTPRPPSEGVRRLEMKHG